MRYRITCITPPPRYPDGILRVWTEGAWVALTLRTAVSLDLD